MKLTNKEKRELIDELLKRFEDYVFNMACLYRDGLITPEMYQDQVQKDLKMVSMTFKTTLLGKK